jgi:putative SOS response-associated peptidase YedK
MCGRYVVKNPVTKTSKLVKSAIQVEILKIIMLTLIKKLPVIKKYKNGNTLEALKWGLIPGWAKDKDFKALINARLETIDEKGFI